ncbi:hypothetical protein DPMN_177799 [Dreissena polymorpha]|uniref:Uncharacterized protein n=1 Tax=Dreissena polymorpha TaxID=45954 RepID=A0A9D4II44_DREPO|nr:hypothetical protein DPMN_177799 [Dreissena polymorpha]
MTLASYVVFAAEGHHQQGRTFMFFQYISGLTVMESGGVCPVCTGLTFLIAVILRLYGATLPLLCLTSSP